MEKRLKSSSICISPHCYVPRTVHVTQCCPAAMFRSTVWRVEDYRLHKQLYKGKASLLYKATCLQSGLPVALKLYRKARLSVLNWYQARFTSDSPFSSWHVHDAHFPGDVLRFNLQVQREIRIHSQLQHENIIQLYAAFEDREHVYLALEYASGAGCRHLCHLLHLHHVPFQCMHADINESCWNCRWGPVHGTQTTRGAPERTESCQGLSAALSVSPAISPPSGE